MLKKERKSGQLSELQFYVCFILMAVVFIVFNQMSNIKLNIAGYSMTGNVFLYPFLYLFSTMITKKYGREKALTAVLLTSLLQAGIYIGMDIIEPTNIEALTITGNIVAFLTSQVAIVFLYHSIDKDMKLASKAGLFVVYVFGILISNLISLGTFNVELIGNFEMFYATTSAVQALVALLIIYVEYLVEKETKNKEN